MIPFSFNLRPKWEKEEIVRQYTEDLLARADMSKIDKINQWCRDTHKEHPVIPGSFREMIQLPYEKLKEIPPQLYGPVKSDPFPESLAKYMIHTLYEKHVPRKYLIDKLGVTVCPYCNRMYINRSETHTVCQLDHFFGKRDYPVLAVSFYNLVPCCGTCNLIKKDKKLGYSPYDRSAGSADDLVEFRYQAVTYNQMAGIEAPDKIEILHKRGDMIKNKEVLELEELYQLHRDIARELLEKKRIYKGHYATYLKTHYKKLSIEPERLVTGNYTKPQEYGKRPLAKMTADISREIKLI